MHVFSTVKVKVGDEMLQSAYLCVILHVQDKKLRVITILTWFLILGKIQAYCNPPIAHDMNDAGCVKGRPQDRGNSLFKNLLG